MLYELENETAGIPKEGVTAPIQKFILSKNYQWLQDIL